MFCNFFRDRGVGNLFVCDSNVFVVDVVLVRIGYVLVKDFKGDGDECGVSYLCVIMVCSDFMEFIGVNFGYGMFIGSGIVFDRNLGRYVFYGGDFLFVYWWLVVG